MTGEQFREKLADTENPVVVYIWAPWCRPCRSMSPLIEEMGRDYEGRVELWKINADEDPEAGAALRVKVIPSVIVFTGGQEIARVRGSQSRTAVERLFETALGNVGEFHHQSGAWLESAIWLGAGSVLVAGSWIAGGSTILLVVGGLLFATGLLKLIKRD